VNPRKPRHAANGRAFSTILFGLRDAPGDRLTFGEVVDAFGDRAFGAVMLVLSLINLLPLPPGGTTITGAPLLFVTLQLAFGSEHLWLPRFVTRSSVSRVAFDQGLERFTGWIHRIERLTRPRLRFLVGQTGQVLMGICGFVLTVVLVLPVPLGNLAPALTLALFSVALMQRDGVAALLGWIAAGVSFALLALVWNVFWAAAEHVWERVQHLF
jgi:hypothetical protein